MRELLAGRDVPCPSCAYNLRDLCSDRCPECSKAISIDILLQHPPAVSALPFGIALASLGMGLTTSLDCWQGLLRYGQLRPWGYFLSWGTPMSLRMCLSALFWLSMLPAAVLLVALHRRFNRLAAPWRWSIAAAIALAGVAGHRRLLLPDWF